MRIRIFTVVAVLALLLGTGLYLGLRGGHLPSLPLAQPACTVGDGRVVLDPEQMANAATIAAVGIRRGLPEQAVVVALATALQESKLRNIAGGDRDSVGLFQQRPSQGWGGATQLRDPRVAAGKFYTALVKVKGWKSMRVTDAAQRVQRSAYPEAYEKWADESAVVAGALFGSATGAVACMLPTEPELRGVAAATALAAGMRLDWGTALDAAGAATALTVAARDARTGWRYAHWLVSHAQDHGVKRVRYASLEWTAKGGTWGPVADGSTGVVAEVFG